MAAFRRDFMELWESELKFQARNMGLRDERSLSIAQHVAWSAYTNRHTKRVVDKAQSAG